MYFLFRNMKEVWDREQAEVESREQPQFVTMQFVNDRTRDLRRYNPPVANEVAAVFVGDDGLPPNIVNFTVYDRNPNPQHHRLCQPSNSLHADPMLYPLLFPYGESGWHIGLQQEGVRRTGRTITGIRLGSLHVIVQPFDMMATMISDMLTLV